jgi:hypothetical protein
MEEMLNELRMDFLVTNVELFEIRNGHVRVLLMIWEDESNVGFD